jgi:excisionase family DNA binding protein
MEGERVAAVTRPLNEEQAAAAAETSHRLAELIDRVSGIPGAQARRFVLRPDNGEQDVVLEVPFGALELLRDLLREMGKGNAVSILPVNAELTTQEAADILNVSRPFVVQLVEEGRLPARRVGTHRRISVEDVMNYKRQDDEQRARVADELAREAREMGLGY